MFPVTLFDYNGVLADDEHVHLEAFQDALRPLGIELDEAAYWERYLGFDDYGAFEAILRDSGRDASPPAVRALIEAKKPLYMKRAELGLKTFEGAGALFRARLAAGPVVVVSGALRAEIEFGLAQLGVAGEVLGIVSAEDTVVSKPDPEGYHKGIELLKTVAGEAAGRGLVFEDSPAGIEAALACGLTVVALAHSYSVAELEKTGAHLVLPHLSEVSEEKLSALYQARFGESRS